MLPVWLRCWIDWNQYSPSRWPPWIDAYALIQSGFDVGNLIPGAFHQLIYATAKTATKPDGAWHGRGTGAKG
jgi:hypothetical protein